MRRRRTMHSAGSQIGGRAAREGGGRRAPPPCRQMPRQGGGHMTVALGGRGRRGNGGACKERPPPSLRVSRPICTAAAWAACPAGHHEGCAPVARWPASPRRLCFRPDRHRRAHLQLPPSRPAAERLLRRPRRPRRRQRQPRAGHSLAMDESSMTGQSKIVHKDQKAPIFMSGCKVADSYGSMFARTTW